jgi:uncharacterized protein (DUF433 family)
MTTKSQPFSLRLSPRMDMLVAEEARRTRRSKGAIIEALADEALRIRRYPGIAFRGVDWERRPWIMGTALDIWEIVRAYRDFGCIEDMTRETDLTDRQIRLALAYYEDFPDEIDLAIAEADRTLDELHALFPTIDIVFVDA